MREIFMCLSHIEVEGGIKALDSLVVYRVCAIKRLLIPAKNFLRAFLVPGNVMSRYAGVVVVFLCSHACRKSRRASSGLPSISAFMPSAQSLTTGLFVSIFAV